MPITNQRNRDKATELPVMPEFRGRISRIPELLLAPRRREYRKIESKAPCAQASTLPSVSGARSDHADEAALKRSYANTRGLIAIHV
jgi:hypothetical protein